MSKELIERLRLIACEGCYPDDTQEAADTLEQQAARIVELDAQLAAREQSEPWSGLEPRERELYVQQILDYGAGFVAPLYATIEHIEESLKARNKTTPQAAREQSEPVGEIVTEPFGEGGKDICILKWQGDYKPQLGDKLYTTPQPTPMRELSDEEIGEFAERSGLVFIFQEDWLCNYSSQDNIKNEVIKLVRSCIAASRTAGERKLKRLAKGWQQCPDCNRLHTQISEDSAFVQAHRKASGTPAMERDALRYRWLRDNKHLDIWWSVEGNSDHNQNIDDDIDEAMQANSAAKEKAQ